MANQEHLDILKQGVKTWNQWMKEHTDVKIDLRGADLTGATLTKADLTEADLTRAILVETNLTHAKLNGCSIYGISAWDILLEEAQQFNLNIAPFSQSAITVDNLEVAQFIYLLLNNRKIRDVIDTLTTKAVLILGRFTPERKAVLEALRKGLRAQGYLPILFDFETPGSRNVTETVSTLAHLSHFILADLTDPSSIPHELRTIAPTLAVPIQPIIEATQTAYSMFSDFERYHWILPIYRYADLATLLTDLREHVLAPAQQKALELEKR